jgi:hypothetical protein
LKGLGPARPLSRARAFPRDSIPLGAAANGSLASLPRSPSTDSVRRRTRARDLFDECEPLHDQTALARLTRADDAVNAFPHEVDESLALPEMELDQRFDTGPTFASTEILDRVKRLTVPISRPSGNQPVMLALPGGMLKSLTRPEAPVAVKLGANRPLAR